jgi:membrane protease YdiL (CAAX protease family)
MLLFDWRITNRASKNRSLYLPIDLRQKLEASGRYLFFVKFLILLAVLLVLGGASAWRIILATPYSRSWLAVVGYGVATGTFMLGGRQLALLILKPADNEYLQRGSGFLWIAVFVVGGFTEEVWRGFCIVSLQNNGWRLLSVTLLTSLSFTLAHMSGLPSRIAPGAPDSVCEMAMGLMLGGLFLRTGTVIAPFIASVSYFTGDFLLVRRRYNASRSSNASSEETA